MGISTKAAQLISKLTHATVKKEVTWKRSNPPQYFVAGTEDLVPLFLQCEYKGKLIGLFEKRYKYFHDELEFSWSSSAGICILDLEGNIIWEFSEGMSALNNLFELAREQASGIDDVLDELLDDEI